MLRHVGQIKRHLRAYDLVVVISLLWFMVQFLRFVFPPLFGTFQLVYGVSNTETGLLFTLLMLAYASVQFPAGALGDRFGRSLIILAGSIGFTAAALLAAIAPSFAVVLLAAVLIGLATGPHKTVAIPLLSAKYEDQTGRVLGAMDSVGQFGGVTAPLAVVAVTALLGWRAVFAVAAVVSAVLVALFYRHLRADPVLSVGPVAQDGDGGDGNIGYLTVFANRRILVFVTVAVLFTFAWNGLSSFFPLFLTSEKEVSSDLARMLYSLLFVASLSQAVTGDLSDRFGRLEIALGLLGGMVIGIGGLVLADATPLLVILTVISGIAFHGFRPVRDSYLMDVLPDEVSGGALGVVRTCMTGVGAFGPAVVGYLSDAAGFTVAFGAVALAVSLAGGLVGALR